MFKFKKIYLIILLLFAVTFIAYFQTLQMYFWIDDNALIYKLQHIDTYTGFWGKGVVGEGPYRHIIDQFVPFYPIFKTNPTPYFAVGIVLYFFAALTLYFFVKQISKNTKLAFSSAVIFAAGYVGSESIFGITNSWQTSRGIIMALLTFMSFYKFIKTKNAFYFLLSIVLFFYSLDTVFVRAHGLIFSIFFFDLLFWPVKFKLKSFMGLFIRQTPFFLIHYYVYLTSLALAKKFGILDILQEIFIDGKYYLAFIPLQNIGNLLIPDKITLLGDVFISNFTHIPSSFSPSAAFSGVLFPFLIIYLSLKFRKKENFLVRLLIFSAVWMIGNMAVFFLRETSLILQTTHRYLTYSFVGLSIFWASAITLFVKNLKSYQKIKFIALNVLVVVIYLTLGISYQHIFNKQRSFPARNFFSDFQKAIPQIPKGSLIFFDVANNQRVKNEYNGFFGGMFSEAGNLSILGYVEDYTNDFLVTYDFNVLFSMIKNRDVTVDKIYAFYYGQNGLVDNSVKVRNLINQQRELIIKLENISSTTPFKNDEAHFYTGTKIENTKNGYFGNNPTVTINLPADTTSLVPSVFTASIKLEPKLIDFPYSDSKQLNISTERRKKIFAYILAKADFQKNALVKSASFWNDQEPKLAIDGRDDTSWRGHRGFWDDLDRGIISTPEYLMLDLKTEKRISQLRWISGFPPLIPTHYRIFVSIDGQNWKLVKEVMKGEKLPSGSLIRDSFEPVNLRFIKMEILKTYGNDGPEIKEIEVVEEEFIDLDSQNINLIKLNPFAGIYDYDEYNAARKFTEEYSNLRFYWMSDAEESQDPNKYVDIPLKIDGEFHEYKINLPVSGLRWVKFTMDGFNSPMALWIDDVKIVYGN